MNKFDITIIIPCFNEERNIRLGALEAVAHYLDKNEFEAGVLIVDDGSKDESRKLIDEFIRDHPRFKLIKKNHQGKAATVIAGILAAKTDYILFTDLDQATPINQIEKVIPQLKKGYDIVIGSRNNQRKGAPIMRLAMARGFMMLRNAILDLKLKDTQCGFKAFRKITAVDIIRRLKVCSLKRTVSGSTVTAGFDVEFLYIAKQLQYKIIEVPVEWHYQETRHINPVKDSIEGVMDLIKIRFTSYSGKYNI